MPKHQLDEEVEDILQHYGIKGMKWGVRRSDAELAAAEGGGGGGGGPEEEEEMSEEERAAREEFPAIWDLMDKTEAAAIAFDKTINNIDMKITEIKSSIKSAGEKILTTLFGKGGDGKWKKAKPSDSKNAKAIKEAMVQYHNASPAEKRLMKKGYKADTTTSIQKKPNKVTAVDKAKAQRKARSTPEAKRKQHEFKKKLYKSDQKAVRTKASDKRATS